MMLVEKHRKASSVNEEREYLAAQVCKCGGRYKKTKHMHVKNRWTGQHYDILRCSCTRCGDQRAFWFNISDFHARNN